MWNFTKHELHVTDVTNASRTMLFNIHTREWDNELLDMLDIPRSMLPEVKASSEIYGHTTTVFASKIPSRASRAISTRHCSARCARRRAW